jgi:ribosome modulation factor
MIYIRKCKSCGTQFETDKPKKQLCAVCFRQRLTRAGRRGYRAGLNNLSRISSGFERCSNWDRLSFGFRLMRGD